MGTGVVTSEQHTHRGLLPDLLTGNYHAARPGHLAGVPRGDISALDRIDPGALEQRTHDLSTAWTGQGRTGNAQPAAAHGGVG
jgi:hypothetical protein